MRSLIERFLDYRRNKLSELSPLFKGLARGQRPSVLLFACSDSRIDPNLITSSLPGEIFVHRNVGNLIPPARADGMSSGNLCEAASIEFALEFLGVKEVVIVGHSMCGAMQAFLEGVSDPSLAPNLKEWISLARPAFRYMSDFSDTGLSEVDSLSQANVLAQMEHAASYPAIRRRLADQSITLHGAWFEVATGLVYSLSPKERRFVAVDAGPGKQR